MFKTLTDLNKTIFNKVSPQSELLHYWIFLHSYTTVFHTIKELSHSLISTPHVSTILHINYLLACNVCSEKYQWIKQTPAFDLIKGNQNYKSAHVTFYGMILSALSYMIKHDFFFSKKRLRRMTMTSMTMTTITMELGGGCGKDARRSWNMEVGGRMF